MERRAAQSRFDQAKGFVADRAFGNIRIDSLDSKPQRKTNHNVLAAEGVMLIAMLTAACSGDKTPVTSTPSLPNETVPPPSLVVPTEQPTPVVTSIPTPDITPAPTLMPVTSLFEGEIVKPTVSDVTTEIKTAFTNNPNAVYGHLDQTLALNFWKYCQKGDPSIPGDLNSNKEFNCETLIGLMYKDEYIRLNDSSFYDVAKQVYDYAAKTLPSDQVKILKTNLEKLL